MHEQKNIIKVIFIEEDEGYCKQIYKTVDNKSKQIYGRDTLGKWYTIANNDSYRELSSPITDNIEIQVIDKNTGNVIFTSNTENNIINYPFIQNKCKNEWMKYSQAYKLSDENFEKWICGFMDLDKYPKFKEDNAECVREDNWIDFSSEKYATDVLHSFNYLGTDYVIAKYYYKHKICGVKWAEYWISEKNFKDRYQYFIGWTKEE